MDFAVLPPEINSGRMYTGPGSEPMWAAAAAWDGLGVELSSAAAAYRSVVSGLTRGPWLGPASASMGAAAAPYVAWMSTTAEQVKQAANQARSAAAAYEAAFAATVPPPVIAQNRALLMSLVATNILGQNTPAIAATETHYAEMWAQDATAMYGYASGSAVASTLTPFTPPPQDTNPAGVGAQATAVGAAAGTPAATHSPTALSRLVSTVPTVLQALASADPTPTGGPSAADVLNFASGLTFITSGVEFILGPLLVGPIASGTLPASSLGFYGPALGASGAAALLGDRAPGGLGLGSAGMSAGLGRTEVLAGLGRAGSISGLSVPQTWAGAAPAITRVATGLPEPTLVGLPEAEVDGFGPGYGGILPGSLMAAAAGGGGAAGGGWAATRGGVAAQRGGAAAQPGGGTRTRYGPPPAVIPQVAREAGLHEGTHGQPTWPDQRAQGGESPLSPNLRDEINELRKQIAELAMERDVLMRSLALWARDSMGQ
jgi:PPE-repeat protein